MPDSISDDTKTDGLIVIGFYLGDDEASERSGGAAVVDHDADEQPVLVPRQVMLDWADSQRHDRLLADSEAQGQAQRDRERLAVARFVATYWHGAMFGQRQAVACHVLGLVQAALVGETDAGQLGIDEGSRYRLEAARAGTP